MSHSLIRIKGSLVNTPHLIEQNTFNGIMEYVNQRIEGNVDVTPKAFNDDDDDYSHRYVSDTATGVIHINGPLTYRRTGWEAWCGGTSYEAIKEQMEYFVESGAKTVAMMADSGGGEAHAMMDSANYIRKLADDNDIKIIAYVDGMAASACYGLVCVADEIIASSDSMVGSIGVLIQLINNSKALEKQGYERTFVTAGKDKVPYGPDGSFTKEFIDRLQTQVDALYEGFTSHVADHRSIDVKAVKDTEANVFMVDEAMSIGLIDKVMTVEEFYNYLADVAQNNIEGTNMGIKEAFKFTSKGDKAEMAKLEELQALLETEQVARTKAETALSEFTEQLTAQTNLVASLTTQLEEFKEAKLNAEKAAADLIVSTRKAALADVVPEAELETYMTNMSSLDEGAFTFMVGQLKAVKDTRADSFKAVGEEGAETEEVTLTTSEQIRLAGIEAAKARRG